MPIPKLSNVSSIYGAPMGRSDSHDEESKNRHVKFHLVRLRMVDYDYDEGGAYWGGAVPSGVMYRAYCPDGIKWQIDLFMRARSRDEAKAAVRKHYPQAVFYR